VQTGRDRDWLYVVHVNTFKDKQSRDSWKAPGPTIPDLDRALQGYSYDIVEISGETAAHTLVRWVDESSIDVLVISAGRSRRLPNPMQSRTTDYIASNSACATLVIHPKVRLLPSTIYAGTVVGPVTCHVIAVISSKLLEQNRCGNPARSVSCLDDNRRMWTAWLLVHANCKDKSTHVEPFSHAAHVFT
jgi:hypothetical protein